jgi:putative inorganic carbon (HCO3(-)) transporter
VSLAVARLAEPRYLTGVIGFFLAVVMGALAGVDPKLAIAGALAIAFVLVALTDLAIGLTIFSVLTFLELAPVAGGPAVSFAKLAGLTLAISWLASATTDRQRTRLFFSAHPGLTAVIVLFLLWNVLSIVWAESSSTAESTVFRYALNVVLFPIVYAAIREPRHLRWIAAAFAVGAGMAASYGLVVVPSAAGAASSVTAAGDLDRISGTIGDPNLLASVLVVGLVMSLAVTLDGTRLPITRALCAFGCMLSMLTIFATVSRGGVIALAAALLAAVVVAGQWRGRVALGVALLVTISVGYFALVASDAQIQRLENADGGSGRTDIWKVGWRMVEAHPGVGVGTGNFSVSSIHYLLVKPGALERDEFIVDEPAVAHNLYLEILAELGIPGLALFMALVLTSMYSAVRAGNLLDRLGEPGLGMVSRAVAIGLFSTMAADFFLSAELSKQLWLLLALGPAALGLARRMQKAAASSQPASSGGGA